MTLPALTFQLPLANAGSNAALISFGIYTAAVFLLAWLSNRTASGKSFLSEYFLGSRNLGVWAFALTFAATSSSGGSFMGFPSKIYTHGWSLALWIGSYMIVPAFVMALLSKRINQVARKTGAITVPDVLHDRFESAKFGSLATLLIVFFMSVNLVAQFKAGSKILRTLLDDVPAFQNVTQSVGSFVHENSLPAGSEGSGYMICLLAFALAVIVYTAYGGFRAVVWTDVMQGLVMVGGVLIMLPLTLHMVGGLPNATEQLAEMTPPRWKLAQFDLAQPAEEDFVVSKTTWVEIPASTKQQRRVFRLAEDVVILKDKSSSDLVKVLEITTPQEVERIHPDDLSIPYVLAAFDIAQIKLEEPAEQDFGIPVGSFIQVSDDGGFARTVRACRISSGEQTAKLLRNSSAQIPVRVVETGQADVEKLTAVVTGHYRFGDSKPGVYVTGPGPSPTDEGGFLPLSLAISFFCMWAFAGAGQPSSMVRQMAFRDSNTLRKAVFTVSIYYSLIYFPLVVIFVCARVVLPGWEIDPDRIMPEMAKAVSAAIEHPWLAGLLVAAPFAAVMSTVDSFLLMISSAVVRDVYQRHINPQASDKSIKRLTYAVTVFIGLAAVFGALYPPAYLQDIIVYTGSGLAACFLVPMSLALYWRRFNTTGAIASMAGGFATHLATYVGGLITYEQFRPIRVFNFDPIVTALLPSLLIAIVVTLSTAPPPERLVRKFFYRDKS